MSEPEIDRIMGAALETALREHGVWMKPESHGWVLVEGTIYLSEFARDYRAALLKAGYRIELDPAALLARGEENVVGGRVK